MSKKSGFTLVELMVVIVIIGVLAAVAIPKMMAATNKAKAGEGPQILGTIANMQHAFKAEQDTFTNCALSGTAVSADFGWKEIGFDQNPGSRYYNFDVVSGGSDFIGKAALRVALGQALSGMDLTINEMDERLVNGSTNSNGTTDELGRLVPNWR
ncbi:MAG: prepilin-type N-terminal cleavage/methylation domain-containing protein [Chitinispirillales bacterium]|jgi:prepilin-type N-terminal cleavage/methylation domain-containing protein|nr:prepilin-type N-terminal cleavage/methylation domain-containing protein [Chitinispirillales bacterium]